MKLRYDRASDAAYIYLVSMPDGGVAKTYPCNPREVRRMINLDFDAEGRLLGIEILDASRKLPKAVLDKAE